MEVTGVPNLTSTAAPNNQKPLPALEKIPVLRTLKTDLAAVNPVAQNTIPEELPKKIEEENLEKKKMEAARLAEETKARQEIVARLASELEAREKAEKIRQENERLASEEKRRLEQSAQVGSQRIIPPQTIPNQAMIQAERERKEREAREKYERDRLAQIEKLKQIEAQKKVEVLPKQVVSKFEIPVRPRKRITGKKIFLVATLVTIASWILEAAIYYAFFDI